MAFTKHPYKLELQRKTSPKGKDFSGIPVIRDKRGRAIYRWDAYFSDMPPNEARKRDVWELAEYLDQKRLMAKTRQSQIEEKRMKIHKNLYKSA